MSRLSVYGAKPARLLKQLSSSQLTVPKTGSFCAGFEVQRWCCDKLADHLIEWMADYALSEEELQVHHGNMYVRLKEAAARVYASKKYEGRGEIGEILLHAICRDFFDTIPIAPRVFYLTSSNDVVKSFDLVHVRGTTTGEFEIWLGEAKFYGDAASAVRAAVDSIETHIDAGFLNKEKLLLRGQISKSAPRYDDICRLFETQTSLDDLFDAAVFPVCIACDSAAAAKSKKADEEYVKLVKSELSQLAARLGASGIAREIVLHLIYVPLGSKEALAQAFDKRLKGLAP
ncbi:DUF1837 domain-containing protein [Rhizobium leguminosarum]|uniref:HamA C-terminal domain-containing protein n=1 Tax=Rhizobium leguminosarum TaxID=384 RepID=UPI001031A502|nr:DUF1837 domain-containing protein [Rhizobium leguminosarum]TBG66112.1 DUF1837 domain-containing protein [Rhizobium leguminosarum]TBG70870.1 DUF1837 domain-containing protein [Rhizobium leguminosarum]